MHSTNRLFRLAVVLTIAVTIIAGCASGQEEMDTIKIQMSWLTNSQHAGWLMAKDKGYYAEENIEVEIVPGGPNLSAPQQVASGAVDLGLADYPEIIGARQEDVPVVSIAHVYHGTPRRLVVWTDSGIQTPADFAGRNIGLQFGGEEFEFMALMNQFGLDWQQDMSIVQQGFGLDLFVSGEIDVGQAMTYNQLLWLFNSGVTEDEVIVFDLTDYGVAMASQVLLARDDWLEENQDLAARFIRASIKGWQYALEHRDEAIDVTMTYMEEGVTTPEEQAETLDVIAEMVILEGMSPDDIMAIDADDLENSCQIAYDFGMVDEPVDCAATYTAKPWEEATGRDTPDF